MFFKNPDKKPEITETQEEIIGKTEPYKEYSEEQIKKQVDKEESLIDDAIKNMINLGMLHVTKNLRYRRECS